MEVHITNRSLEQIEESEITTAQRIIEGMAEIEISVNDWAAIAVDNYLDAIDDLSKCREILKAAAEIGKNPRADDSFFDGSGELDVWIEATARYSGGFIEIGVFYTDILRYYPGSCDDDAMEYRSAVTAQLFRPKMTFPHRKIKASPVPAGARSARRGH